MILSYLLVCSFRRQSGCQKLFGSKFDETGSLAWKVFRLKAKILRSLSIAGMGFGFFGLVLALHWGTVYSLEILHKANAVDTIGLYFCLGSK